VSAFGVLARLVRAEWRQWSRRGDGLPVALVVVVAVGLYGGLLAGVLQTGSLAGGLRDLAAIPPTGMHLALRVQRDAMLGLGIVGVTWAAAALAGDRERGTLRLLALRTPRALLPLGKGALLLGMLAATALATLAVADLVGVLTLGLTGVVNPQAGVVTRAELLGAGLVATLLTLPTLASALAITLAISARSRTAGVAQATAAAVLLVLAGMTMVPGAAPVSFLDTAAWPFEVAMRLASGLPAPAAEHLLGRHLLVNLAWTASGLLAAAGLCHRQDMA
jgi:hypothetical protein